MRTPYPAGLVAVGKDTSVHAPCPTGLATVDIEDSKKVLGVSSRFIVITVVKLWDNIQIIYLGVRESLLILNKRDMHCTISYLNSEYLKESVCSTGRSFYLYSLRNIISRFLLS